ncbi:MAG: exonuclease SbcD [Planctomycetota bacterium]|jgi:exonuclease SbcD
MSLDKSEPPALPPDVSALSTGADAGASEASARLLFVGDVHLGRSPGGLPADVEPTPFGPRAALANLVEKALDESYDAVLFAGDVVDTARDFFEAYAPLTDAARRLLTAGIEVICVSGNHDVQVLPRLVKEVPGVRLLGAGGTWETHIVQRDGQPVARILGWSFPRPRVTMSPLGNFDASILAGGPVGVPTIGLLHADLDASKSHYAPVARRELEAVAGVDAWMLGHIHAPSKLTGVARPIGYLGSLSALDPGAPGRRGPWELNWDRSGLSLVQLVSSALRFERVDLDVSPAQDADGLEELLARAVRETSERVQEDGGEARLIGVRVRLVGRSHLARLERDRVREEALRGLGGAGENGAYLEAIIDEALPAVDLERLARYADPLGLVARRVLSLQANDGEGRRLAKRALPELRSRAEHATFTTHLGAFDLDEEGARLVLLEAGRQILDALVAQRPEVLEEDDMLEPMPRQKKGDNAGDDGESFALEQDEEESIR